MKRIPHALILILVSGAAEAQYQVMVGARGWSEADYNWATHTGGYTRLASFGSPTASVTPDQAGTATSAFAYVSGNGPDYPHNPNTYDIVRSEVSLESASMSMSEYDTATDGVYTGNDGGDTHGEFIDHLTFNVAGATGTTVTQIGYTFTMRGYIRQSGSFAEGNAHDVDSSWHFGSSQGQVSIQLDSSSNYVGYINGYNGTGTFTSVTPQLIVQTGIFSITGASYSADIGMQLSGHLANGMDVGYTSSIEFAPVAGFTMTSSSGVFGTTPVPEPCSLLIVSGGLAALVRRRRQAN